MSKSGPADGRNELWNDSRVLPDLLLEQRGLTEKEFEIVEAYEFITRIVDIPPDPDKPEHRDFSRTVKEYAMIVSYKIVPDDTIAIVRHAWTMDAQTNTIKNLEHLLVSN